MLAQRIVRRVAVAFVLVAVAFAFAARVGAQKQLAPLKELENRPQFADISRFKSGQEKPVAADKDKIDAEAKYLVYRFSAQPPIFGDANKGMQKYQNDFMEYIRQIENAEAWKKNGEFRRQLSLALVPRFKDLLTEDFQENRVAIVNCAPMLAHAARLKDEAIGNYLADILNGKSHDAIKLYAARGLREFFPVVIVDAGAVLAAADVKRKDRDVKYVDAIVNFAQRPGGDKLSEPEQNAIRFLRRESIESLAHTQAPLVVTDKVKVVEGPIAPLFLRVLSPKGGLDPAPGLPERVEAAIGVCQMKNLDAANYHAELGVYLVARLVNDLADAYNKDLVDMRTKPAQMLWKVQSKRLELALKDLAKNVKNQPVEPKARQLTEEATILIKSMQTYNQVNQNQLLLFGKMAATLRPTSNEVFRGNKTFVVELE